MVVSRRLMQTGRIDALDQGVILSEVQSLFISKGYHIWVIDSGGI
jgi:hypothetical protein